MPDLTVSLNAAQAQRVAVALGKRLNLKTDTIPPEPRNATMAEAQQFVRDVLRGIVMEEERKGFVVPEL